MNANLFSLNRIVERPKLKKEQIEKDYIKDEAEKKEFTAEAIPVLEEDTCSLVPIELGQLSPAKLELVEVDTISKVENIIRPYEKRNMKEASATIEKSPTSYQLEKLEALVEKTFNAVKELTPTTPPPKVHTHSYSGDRLWSDLKCPICRIKTQPVVFESKEQMTQREKEEDKMILKVSLEMDRELLKKTRVSIV